MKVNVTRNRTPTPHAICPNAVSNLSVRLSGTPTRPSADKFPVTEFCLSNLNRCMSRSFCLPLSPTLSLSVSLSLPRSQKSAGYLSTQLTAWFFCFSSFFLTFRFWVWALAIICYVHICVRNFYFVRNIHLYNCIYKFTCSYLHALLVFPLGLLLINIFFEFAIYFWLYFSFPLIGITVFPIWMRACVRACLCVYVWPISV